MSSQVFYRKWRPQTLSQVAGQEQVTRTLLNALTSGRLSHAYLFSGPRGTGKTSTGRILAKAVNCLEGGKGEPCNQCAVCQAITGGRALDVIEIDAASNRRIDEIRELRERVGYLPNQARYKVYIIDEVHMLTTEAANALLKTLEEPPPHVIFVLVTTEAHKLLPTILSRCQRFDFHRIPQKDVVSKLSEICQGEGIRIDADGLQLIARSAQGSLRDAENILEQLFTYYGSDVKRRDVATVLGITEDQRTRELLKHIVGGDLSAGILTLNSVNGDGLDLKQFNRELVNCLRGLLLVKTGAGSSLDFSAEDMSLLQELAEHASLNRILRAVKLFGQVDFGLDAYSTLPLELAMVDCILAESEVQEKTAAAGEPAKASPGDGKTAGVNKAKAEVVKATPGADKIPAAADESAPVIAKDKPENMEDTTGSGKTRSGSAGVAPEIRELRTEKGVSGKTPGDAPIFSAPGSELEKLQINWKQVVAQAPADVIRTPAVALLRSAGAVPVAIEGDTVVLAFKYSIHKERMSQPGNQKIAGRVISSFLGRKVNVRCTYQAEDNHLVAEAQRMGAQIMSVEEK
ncbi:MAG: DNA polymerase III subunit gamma/tau [Chloroflexota bacterium]